MEQVNSVPTNWYHSRQFLTIVIIVGVILIVLGVFAYFKIFAPTNIFFPASKLSEEFLASKLSEEFIGSLKEISVLEQDITDSFNMDLTGLNEKESAKDFDGALKIIKMAGLKNVKMPTKLLTFINKTVELKALAEKIADPAVKESALKLVKLLEQKSKANFDFFHAQRRIIQESIDYYADRKAGKTVNLPADFPYLTEQAKKAAEDLKNINAQYSQALQNLAKEFGATLNQIINQ